MGNIIGTTTDPFDASHNLSSTALFNEYKHCPTIYNILIPTYDYILLLSILYTFIDELYKVINMIIVIKYNYWILYKRYSQLPSNLLNQYVSISPSSSSTSLELGNNISNHNITSLDSPKVYPIKSSDVEIIIESDSFNNISVHNTNINTKLYNDTQIKNAIVNKVIDDFKYPRINYFLIQQILCSIYIFIYSLSTIKSHRSSIWLNYINFYGFIVNTNILELLVSSLWEIRQLNRQISSLNYNDPRTHNFHAKIICGVGLASSFLILAPIIITHIIPMMIIYIWVVVSYSLIILLGGVCFTIIHVVIGYICGFIIISIAKLIFYISDININSNTAHFEELRERMIKNWFYGTAFRFSIVVLFVILYNYGSIFYLIPNINEKKYFGLIGVDYHLHTNISCFYHYSTEISTKGFLVFMQFII